MAQALTALAGEGVGERGIEVGGAVAVEEAEQACGVGGQAIAAAGEVLEEGVGVGAGLAEAIPAAQVVGVPLGGGERGQVGLGLDDAARDRSERGWRATSVAPSRMRTEGSLATRVSGRRTRRMRDRVVVAVEADVGRLAGDDGADEIAGEGMRRAAGSRRGRSSSRASATRRPVGIARDAARVCAVSAIHWASCALRSSTEVKRRAAKNEWRRY